MARCSRADSTTIRRRQYQTECLVGHRNTPCRWTLIPVSVTACCSRRVALSAAIRRRRYHCRLAALGRAQIQPPCTSGGSQAHSWSSDVDAGVTDSDGSKLGCRLQPPYVDAGITDGLRLSGTLHVVGRGRQYHCGWKLSGTLSAAKRVGCRRRYQ